MKLYRKLLYRPLKTVEQAVRETLFSCMQRLQPSFNPFQKFGVPGGLARCAKQEVFPEEEHPFAPPFSLEETLHPRFCVSMEKTAPAGWSVLPNGITTAQAAILTGQGKLVPEFTEAFSKTKIRDSKLFTFDRRRRNLSIPHIDGRVASLVVDCHWNYYHWLFDALPKLAILEASGQQPDSYYVHSSLPFQRESLAELGIGEDQLLCPEKHPYLSASSLLLTSFPCLLGGMPAYWVCRFLQERFIKEKKGPSLRLYISRRGARYRRVLNEELLLPFLKEEGFVIVQPENLSFRQQVELFSQAKVVIAPHGAGLSNLVFAPPGAQLIELLPPREPCVCFWQLANNCGHRYAFFRSLPDPATYSLETEGRDDLLIDLEGFKKFTALVLKK